MAGVPGSAHEALARAYVDALSRGDLPALAALFHEGARVEGTYGEPTVAGLVDSVRQLRAAFPDWVVAIDDIAFDGDRAILRCTERGTSRGRFLGQPATSKGFRIGTVEWLRIEDGKIRERWAGRDTMAILRQTGADASVGRTSSLALLVLVAVLAIGASSFILFIADTVRKWLEEATRLVLASPGASFAGVVVGLGLAVLLWAIHRPRDGVLVAAVIPAVVIVAAFVLAAGGAPDPTAGGTVGEAIAAQGLWLMRVDAVAGAGLFAASLAACLAGLSFALRARAVARAPRVTARAMVAPFLVLGATIAAIFWVDGDQKEAHILLLQSALVGVTALVSATTLDGSEEPAVTRDAMSATLFSLVGMLLGVAAVSTQTYLHSRQDSAGWVEIAANFPRSIRDTARHARPYLLPAVAAAIAGARWRPFAAGASLRQVGGPLLGALVATVALGLTLRSAIAGVWLKGQGASLTAIDLHLLDGDEGACDGIRLGAVVRATGGVVTLPDGPAGPDSDAAFKRLEVRAPDDDVWLDLASDATPFREVGELLAAAGRARGPRGLGVAAALVVPPRGCAVVLVGRAPDGAVACSEPVSLAVAGCMTGPSEEPPLRVTVRGDHSVTLGLVRGTFRWERTGTSAQLTELATTAFALAGLHRDPSDRNFDRAVLEVAPSVTQGEAIAALLALRDVGRDHVDFRTGRYRHGPAYLISMGLAGAPAP